MFCLEEIEVGLKVSRSDLIIHKQKYRIGVCKNVPFITKMALPVIVFAGNCDRW